jgi:hypothetical protein
MNHPYLYPDEAPWTEEYQDLRELRTHKREDDDLISEDLYFWRVVFS